MKHCSVWSAEAFCFALILPGGVVFGEYLCQVSVDGVMPTPVHVVRYLFLVTCGVCSLQSIDSYRVAIKVFIPERLTYGSDERPRYPGPFTRSIITNVEKLMRSVHVVLVKRVI